MLDFTYVNDELFCETVPLCAIADAYGTPVYVYSATGILQRCREIEDAFGGLDHLTCYAVKANANRELLRLIAAQGLGADVGSRGELFLALAAGFPPGKITFSGVGKREDEIAYALDQNILAFNVESEEEIEILNQSAGERGARAGILLRVNLDIDAGGHAYISTSTRHNKFGVPRQLAGRVLTHAAMLPHIDVRGVHSHLGSQIIRLSVFQEAARSLAALVEELRRDGVPVHELDFGGGFGVRYRGYLQDPKLPPEEPERRNLMAAAMIRSVLPLLRPTGCRISIQPGRAIIAQAGALVVRVLYRKKSDAKTFIVVDGGMNDMMRPSLYGSHHQIVPLRLTGASAERVDIVGPVCESGDFFAKDRPLPVVHRGDLLAILCTGAYGYVLSSNYNARLRLPEVLIEGSAHRLIRPRETVEQL